MSALFLAVDHTITATSRALFTKSIILSRSVVVPLGITNRAPMLLLRPRENPIAAAGLTISEIIAQSFNSENQAGREQYDGDY